MTQVKYLVGKTIKAAMWSGPLALFLEEVIQHAKKNFDGHFTFFSFTTDYTGCYGTPSGEELRSDLHDLPKHTSFLDLLMDMAYQPELYDMWKLKQAKALRRLRDHA